MTDKEIQDFEGLLDVDETVLDKQSSEQPRLIWKYMRALADAIMASDYAEAEFKVTQAELDEDIRASPNDYGIDKITEPAVKLALARTQDYQKAQTKVIKCRYAVKVQEAAVASLDHRRTTLSHFIQLREQSYFAQPRQGGTGWQKRRQKA